MSSSGRLLARVVLCAGLCSVGQDGASEGRIVYDYDDRGRLVEIGIDDHGDRRVIAIRYGSPDEDNGSERFRVLVSVPGDADADGLPDAWEEGYALDPIASRDVYDDPDDDGRTNLQEYLSGTSPRLNVAVLASAIWGLHRPTRAPTAVSDGCGPRAVPLVPQSAPLGAGLCAVGSVTLLLLGE